MDYPEGNYYYYCDGNIIIIDYINNQACENCGLELNLIVQQYGYFTEEYLTL